MALNFGPPVMNFEALGSLGKTFFDAQAAAQKRGIDQQKQQLLAGLGQGNGDYQKVGLGLIGAGDVQSGVALLGLAQKDREQKLQEEAFKTSPFSSAPRAPSAPVPLGSDPRASLIQNESGGRWNAQNSAVGAGGKVGHFGRLQFGQARLEEAAAAGAIPAGTSPQQFMQSPELQQAAERWHFGDIDQNIKANGYDRLVGQPINGVPVTIDGLRAVAHLGGVQGMKRFVETGGRYNPADANGTRLSDYFARHGGGSGQPAQAPVQVAENEADVQRLEARMPGYGGGPVQVAQAPAQAGASVADVPAQGAAPVQGFAVPPGEAGKLPPNDPFPQVTNEQLVQVIRNPRSAPGDKALAQQLFASRQSYASETAPEKREQTRLETQKKGLEVQKLERELKGEGARPMTPEERVAYSVPEGQPAYMNSRGEPKFGPASTKITNSIGAVEGEYAKANGKAISERFSKIVDEGDAAQAEAGAIARLKELGGQIKNMGAGAALQARLAEYGVKVGPNVSEIEAYGALVDKLTPQQRVAGAGATSDFDAKMFKNSLPGLMRTPDGNALILDTLEALNVYKRQRADVVSEAMAMNEKPADVIKRLKELPDPFAAFKEARKTAPAMPATPSASPSPPPAQAQPSAEGWQDLGGGVRIREKR